MQILPRSLEQLKKSVSSSKNRDIRFVNVKVDRRCKYCRGKIWGRRYESYFK